MKRAASAAYVQARDLLQRSTRMELPQKYSRPLIQRQAALLTHFSQSVVGPSLLGAGSLNPEPAMFKQVISACGLIVITSFNSEARPYRIERAFECNITMPCDFSYYSQASNQRNSLQTHRSRQLTVAAIKNITALDAPVSERIVGGRPQGCPSAFCGCAAALRLFGRIVPELNLAANWLRFPRTSPAPGMVAARRGHVFILEQHIGSDVWMAYDANSGGHATRIHARSLRGYTVVNPRGALT